MEGGKALEIPNREYTDQFRDLAVKRVAAGQAIVAVARELGPIEQTLRDEVEALDAGKVGGPQARSVTP
jgi:transposase